jgi:cation/acetate symporter
MTFMTSRRLVNPRLGAYFGIFMSAFIALALVSLILEGLGVDAGWLRYGMLLAPLVLFAAIGLGSFPFSPLACFAAHLPVPAFFNGLALAIAAFGATGFVSLTGVFFLIGFDALCLAIGGLAGFVVMAVMLAPFLRKFGAYTIPSYLAHRFESRVLRVVAAVLLAVPMVMVIAAELKLAGFAAALLSGHSEAQMTFLLAFAMLIALIAGGMRSVTWSGVAQGLAALIAIIVAAVVATMITNMPVPQLTHGPVLRAIGRAEAGLGIPIIIPPNLAFDIPGTGLQPMFKRFSDAFGAVGPVAFVMSTLTMMAGVASAPWLLPRLAAAPGVYEARKSLGWATFLFGIAMLTSASIAVFMRDYVMDLIATPGPAIVPAWLSDLVTRGLASITETGTQFQATSFSFIRDGILFSLPIAAQLPAMLLNLILAGAIAAGLAAASASAVALGNILSEDLVLGATWEPPQGAARSHVARAGLAVAVSAGTAVAVFTTADPLRLVLWALALTGSALFAVLILSIWWKRINSYGALAGVVCGFSVAGLAILAGPTAWNPLDTALAGVIGIPVGAIAACVVALLTPAPGRHLLELVRDIRVPGGEILYDREMRMQRLKKHRQRA